VGKATPTNRVGAPAITVVIPVHNRASLLPRALRSVGAQSGGPPPEVIVVDDASTDSSPSVAEEMGATVLRQVTNEGPAAARDRGLSAASGEWCAFLDSDDWWGPRHLEVLSRWIDPEVALLATSALSTAGDGKTAVAGNPFRRRRHLCGPDSVLQPENVVTTSACMVRTEVARRVGGFGSGRLAEDLDLWLRVLAVAPGLLLPDITVRYGTHAGQTSSDPSMWSTAGGVVARGAPRSARRAFTHVVAWDSFRKALGDGDYPAAARQALPLLSPSGAADTVRLLRRRRARRTRWRERPHDVRLLLAPGEHIPGVA
jgi:GT2 family glycosyltransferase